jgi:hypothetical protein
VTAVNCPACGHALSTVTVGGLSVDVCDGGCGGIWFDHWELQKVDEQGEAAGEQLLDVRRDPGVVVDPAERYRCPKCTDDVVHAPFRDPLLDSERAESAEELARAQKFAHAFRFICPSW